MEKKSFDLVELEKKTNLILVGLVFFELIVLLFLILSVVFPSLEIVLAGVGEDNVTVATQLQVGNVAPEILNFTILNGVFIDLTANSTVNLRVEIIARDFNGEYDINKTNLTFFDNIGSTFGAANDNNVHYTNNSCSINYSYGDQYEVNASCLIPIQYYANNATWNATVVVTDNSTLTAMGSGTVGITALLALIMPDTLDYGEVNATAVSNEKILNVTNGGNVPVNLSLSGYAKTVGDGLAMNCTLGAVKNITLSYERYNVSFSDSSVLGNLTAFNAANYSNLTSAPIVNRFNLYQRQNDAVQYNDETNATYWRIYVPTGVAGNCTGNIVFGAVSTTGA